MAHAAQTAQTAQVAQVAQVAQTWAGWLAGAAGAWLGAERSLSCERRAEVGAGPDGAGHDARQLAG